MNFNEYKNELPYPTKDQFKTTYWYKSGKLIATQLPLGMDGLGGKVVFEPGFTQKDLDSAAVREKNVDEVAYKKAYDTYRTEDGRIHDKFRADLLEDLGMTGHPKADKFFSKAWEDGHAHGYSEVYNVAQNLVDLVL